MAAAVAVAVAAETAVMASAAAAAKTTVMASAAAAERGKNIRTYA